MIDTMTTSRKGIPRMLTHDGRTQNMSAWAREMNMSATAVRSRLRRGLSVSEALTRPPKKDKRRTRPASSTKLLALVIDGETVRAALTNHLRQHLDGAEIASLQPEGDGFRIGLAR